MTNFDEEPDAPLHGECREEIEGLESSLNDADKEIEQLTKDLADGREKLALAMSRATSDPYWPERSNEQKLTLAEIVEKVCESMKNMDDARERALEKRDAASARAERAEAECKRLRSKIGAIMCELSEEAGRGA